MWQYHGYWVPEGAVGERFFRNLTPDGLTMHDAEQVERCVAACGPRLQVAVDGGAYVGTWSLHLAKHFANVIAYEPVPSNVDCWRRNLEGKSHASVVQAALSSHDGLAVMYHMHKAYTGRVRERDFADQANGTAEVRAKRLDDANLPVLDLLKLDVEGHEYHALMGALETIKRCRPVVMIEEKLDFDRSASKLLIDLGMRHTWRKRFDNLFAW